MENKCKHCKGLGKQIRYVPILRGIITTRVICPYCKGTGKEVDKG